MSPYKKFIASVKEYFESVPALKFLLSMYIVVFAVGGFFFLLGSYIFAISNTFITLGTVLMLAGLLLTVIKEDMMTLVITSAIISLGSLIAWIVRLVVWAGSFGFSAAILGDHAFNTGALFYFLAFGFIAVFVFIKSEKFREMRAASAARPAGVACPRCSGFIPASAAFCPQCGAPNPGPLQYAPPAAPQYAPPAEPQYAPPAEPQYAPPAVPQYAPPAAPQYAPPAAPQPEPVAPVTPEPAPVAPVTPEPAPAASAVVCKNCGVDLVPGAAFCGKCGTRQ